MIVYKGKQKLKSGNELACRSSLENNSHVYAYYVSVIGRALVSK